MTVYYKLRLLIWWMKISSSSLSILNTTQIYQQFPTLLVQIQNRHRDRYLGREKKKDNVREDEQLELVIFTQHHFSSVLRTVPSSSRFTFQWTPLHTYPFHCHVPSPQERRGKGSSCSHSTKLPPKHRDRDEKKKSREWSAV